MMLKQSLNRKENFPIRIGTYKISIDGHCATIDATKVYTKLRFYDAWSI